MGFSTTARGRLQATAACTGAIVLSWRFPHLLSLIFLVIATGLMLLAWLAPSRYAPVQRGLDRISHAVVAGVSWIILGLVYFGVFTPLRALRWLTRRPALCLRADPSAETYLTPLSAVSANRFDRQF